jgi:hypothetical protein
MWDEPKSNSGAGRPREGEVRCEVEVEDAEAEAKAEEAVVKCVRDGVFRWVWRGPVPTVRRGLRRGVGVAGVTRVAGTEELTWGAEDQSPSW